MFKVVKTGKNNQKPQNGWGTINKRPVEKELLKKKKGFRIKKKLVKRLNIILDTTNKKTDTIIRQNTVKRHKIVEII